MKILGMAAVLAATTGLGGAAWAQDTFTHSGTLTGATSFHRFTGGLMGAFNYELLQITVTNGAAFVAETTAASLTGPFPSNDTFLYVYNSSFDPSVSNASVAANNNGGVGLLSRIAGPIPDGQYVIVTTTASPGETGTYSLSVIGAILGWGPSDLAELEALIRASGGAGIIVINHARGAAQNGGQTSLETREVSRAFTRLADGTVTMSSQGSAPGMMGNLYTWAEYTGFRSNETGSGTSVIGGSGLAIGADIAIGPDMVAGLALGYSEINASSTGFTQNGTFTYLQPYLSYSSGNWHGDASLIYGIGQFDQTSGGGTGTADVTLAAITFEGGYDYALAPGYTLTPTIGLIHGREEVTGTGGTLTNAGTWTFSQASLGGRIDYVGADGVLFAGIHADYLTQDAGQALAADLFSEQGWTGRVEVGGATDLGNGIGLSTSVELSGLGGDMQTVAGGVRLGFTF